MWSRDGHSLFIEKETGVKLLKKSELYSTDVAECRDHILSMYTQWGTEACFIYKVAWEILSSKKPQS